MVALVANTVLFFVLFTVLARPRTPRRALWQGAFLGSIGFEVLKQLSSFLLAATQRSPAFQAFGIALILLVWINYFSRVVMYAAAWAHTAPGRDAPRRDAADAADPPRPAGAPRVGPSGRESTRRAARACAGSAGPAARLRRGGRGRPRAGGPAPRAGATDSAPTDAEISHHPGTATGRTAR